MSQEVALIVLIKVKSGQSEDQINAYNKLKPQVLAEQGCLQYELKRVGDSDDSFVLLEKWASAEALSAHDVTPHMLAADLQSPSFRAGPATVLTLSAL